MISRAARAFRSFIDASLHSSNSSNMDGGDSNFVPSPRDVLDVKSLLWQKRLPIELVDSIIDFAEYWPHQATEVDRAIQVGNNSSVLYLQTPLLPGVFVPENDKKCGEAEESLAIGNVRTRALNPARKIVFRIWSHDQGWSSNPGRGTYEGSHTWFEAFPERPLSTTAVKQAATLLNPIDITKQENLQKLQSSENGQAWESVVVSTMIHDGGGIKERKVWHIQKNVHAQRETKMHEVVWTWTGKSSDFVKCLRAGDRISVVARALYPGWVNHVEKMQVEVYYAV